MKNIIVLKEEELKKLKIKIFKENKTALRDYGICEGSLDDIYNKCMEVPFAYDAIVNSYAVIIHKYLFVNDIKNWWDKFLSSCRKHKTLVYIMLDDVNVKFNYFRLPDNRKIKLTPAQQYLQDKRRIK